MQGVAVYGEAVRVANDDGGAAGADADVGFVMEPMCAAETLNLFGGFRRGCQASEPLQAKTPVTRAKHPLFIMVPDGAPSKHEEPTPVSLLGRRRSRDPGAAQGATVPTGPGQCGRTYGGRREREQDYGVSRGGRRMPGTKKTAHLSRKALVTSPCRRECQRLPQFPRIGKDYPRLPGNVTLGSRMVSRSRNNQRKDPPSWQESFPGLVRWAPPEKPSS